MKVVELMQRLPNLISSLHQQGIARSSWQQFAQDTSEVFEADGCSFCLREIKKPSAPIILGAGKIDTQNAAALTGKDIDSPVYKLLKDSRVGEVIRHGDINLSDDDKTTSDIEQIVAVTAYRDEKYEAVLSLGRSKQKGGFNEHELALLNAFLPYLTLAIEQYSERLIRKQQFDIQQLLEQFDENLAVVDGQGTLIAFNGHFEQLKVAKELLYVYGSKVNFYDKTIQHWMLDTMKKWHKFSTCECKRLTEQGFDIVMKIKQFNYKDTMSNSDEQRYFLISIGNFDLNLRFKLYKQLFKLTKAEAQLAADLSMGKTINQLASQKLLSKHTLRTQLKSVFAKTQTHSQNELIVLLKNVY